jgi:hypothetical protein
MEERGNISLRRWRARELKQINGVGRGYRRVLKDQSTREKSS